MRPVRVVADSARFPGLKLLRLAWRYRTGSSHIDGAPPVAVTIKNFHLVDAVECVGRGAHLQHFGFGCLAASPEPVAEPDQRCFAEEQKSADSSEDGAEQSENEDQGFVGDVRFLVGDGGSPTSV